MNKRMIETAVGIFVLIGLGCVGYLTIKLGQMEIVGGNYYEVGARFATVTGLNEGSSVEMAGVEVGSVSRISLDPEDKVAVVWMKIDNAVSLYADVTAAVKTNGLIGDKFISLEPGAGFDFDPDAAGTVLADGDMITDTLSAIDIWDLVGKYAFGDIDAAADSEPAAEEEWLP